MSRKASPAPVLIAAWLLPGGGHFLLGRRPQAIVIFLTITITYLFGMYFADFTNVSPSRHPFYFFAYIFNGGTTIVAALATKNLNLTDVPRHFGIASLDIGTVYTAVASLLNVIVMMDAWGRAIGLRPQPKKPGKAEPA